MTWQAWSLLCFLLVSAAFNLGLGEGYRRSRKMIERKMRERKL